ncbi:uncharacterized protein LOC132790465 isoform X3 [Drosophila nasuta]|uniref:uncharacterized protein LOC132790465 isoform X3 n=1 Tax=Drosophila nasuta TaxID=42062 RepID=UPI00295EA83A|nr:uncharacterized protein LOC132790465 isoform X3 [Drosophila nasuta]
MKYQKFYSLLLLVSLTALAAAQYYTPYNPYNTPSPTFASLTNYYYTTPYPYYYPTATPYYYNDPKIRIWPYVIGQYLYPTYYNNNSYNPYASLSTPNWQSYYSNIYQNSWGKK